MTFRKNAQALCILLLMLVVQFMVAQHAMVHPVATDHVASRVADHSDGGTPHDDGHDQCNICQFVTLISHGMGGFVPGMVILAAMLGAAFQGLSPSLPRVWRRIAGYSAHAPPVLHS